MAPTTLGPLSAAAATTAVDPHSTGGGFAILGDGHIPDYDYRAYAIIDGFGIASQFLLACIFYYYSHRGLGTKSLPFSEKMPRQELSDLGSIVCIICCTSYVIRFTWNVQGYGGGSCNPEIFRYFDFCFTCPLIILDICFHVDIPHQLYNIILTILCLVLGGLAQQTKSSVEEWTWFWVGTVYMAMLFAQMMNEIRKRWKEIPEDKEDKMKSPRFALKMALITIFSIWPLFPILYIARESYKSISLELDYVLHMLMDVLAKGVFTGWLVRFRLLMEDIELEDMEEMESNEQRFPGSPMLTDDGEVKTPRSYRHRAQHALSQQQLYALARFMHGHSTATTAPGTPQYRYHEKHLQPNYSDFASALDSGAIKARGMNPPAPPPTKSRATGMPVTRGDAIAMKAASAMGAKSSAAAVDALQGARNSVFPLITSPAARSHRMAAAAGFATGLPGPRLRCARERT
jgi:bacteriorhodopsin